MTLQEPIKFPTEEIADEFNVSFNEPYSAEQLFERDGSLFIKVPEYVAKLVPKGAVATFDNDPNQASFYVVDNDIDSEGKKKVLTYGIPHLDEIPEDAYDFPVAIARGTSAYDIVSSDAEEYENMMKGLNGEVDYDGVQMLMSKGLLNPTSIPFTKVNETESGYILASVFGNGTPEYFNAIEFIRKDLRLDATVDTYSFICGIAGMVWDHETNAFKEPLEELKKTAHIKAIWNDPEGMMEQFKQFFKGMGMNQSPDHTKVSEDNRKKARNKRRNNRKKNAKKLKAKHKHTGDEPVKPIKDKQSILAELLDGEGEVTADQVEAALRYRGK